MSMASRVILSNFFEKQWIQNHPQYLSGLSRAPFPTTFLEIAVSRKFHVVLLQQQRQRNVQKSVPQGKCFAN